MAPILPEFWAVSIQPPVLCGIAHERLTMFHAPFTSASQTRPQFWHENLPATYCPHMPQGEEASYSLGRRLAKGLAISSRTVSAEGPIDSTGLLGSGKCL
jgi:hypothetical protein